MCPRAEEFCSVVVWVLIDILSAWNEESEGSKGGCRKGAAVQKVARKRGKRTQPRPASVKLVRRGCPECSPA